MAQKLTMTKDTLRDALYNESGNPLAEKEIIQNVKDIIKSGGTVECTLDNLIIPVVLDNDDNIKFDIATYNK